MALSTSKHPSTYKSTADVNDRYKEAVRSCCDIKHQLNTFDRKLNAARNYSNSIEKMKASRSTDTGPDQPLTGVMTNRCGYENGMVGRFRSKSRNMANGNAGFRARPPDEWNDWHGSGEIEKRRAQSFSPRKRASSIPVPKSVLYPGILQYVRSRVPNAIDTVRRAPSMRKRAFSEPRQQVLRKRNVNEASEIIKSKTEQTYHTNVPDERNAASVLRGANIEKPLCRSRSHIGIRTKPPQPMSRWEMFEVGLERKINQIRASPKYKPLMERCKGDITPLCTKYTKSTTKTTSSWKAFNVDAATFRFQHLIEWDNDHTLKGDYDSLLIEGPSDGPSYMDASVGRSTELQMNIRDINEAVDCAVPITHLSKFANEPLAEALTNTYQSSVNIRLSRTDTAVQTTSNVDRLEKSIEENNSNDAVKEMWWQRIGDYRKAKKVGNETRETSKEGNADPRSSFQRRTPARRLAGECEMVQHSPSKELVHEPSRIIGESSSSGFPVLNRSDYCGLSPTSSIGESSSSDVIRSSNFKIGPVKDTKFQGAILKTRKQHVVHRSSKSCSPTVGNSVLNSDTVSYENLEGGQRSTADMEMPPEQLVLGDGASSFISPQRLSALRFDQTQERLDECWCVSSQTDGLNKQVQRSLNTLDELTTNIERASKIFDASFGNRLSISACEHTTTPNNSTEKSEHLKHYAVTRLVNHIVTPPLLSSDMSVRRGQALGGRLKAHLVYNQHIDHMEQQLRDAQHLLNITDKTPTPNKAFNEQRNANESQLMNGESTFLVSSQRVDSNTNAHRQIEHSNGGSISPHKSLEMTPQKRMSSTMKYMNADENCDERCKQNTAKNRCISSNENEPFDGTAQKLTSHRGRSLFTQPVETKRRSNGCGVFSYGGNVSLSQTVSKRDVTDSKDLLSCARGRKEIADETIAALRQYYTDVCVFFHVRKKQLMDANKLDEWQELSRKQKSTENDILDMRRIYEQSKHSNKPYDEYLQYHTYETARLHMLSLELREELRTMGQATEDSMRRLDETRKNTEKILRLTAGEFTRRLTKSSERKEAEARRMRREEYLRMRTMNLSKDGSSLAESETGSISSANILLGNRGPLKLVGDTSFRGLLQTCDDRVNFLRNELMQKREEANVLRESFDHKIRAANFDRSIRDLSTRAESSVLEQIKAHEAYINQTANQIAYLEGLEVDQISISSSASLRHESPSSYLSRCDAKSVPTTTAESTKSPLGSLSPTRNAVIVELPSSTTSWNDSSVSQTSALVSESAPQHQNIYPLEKKSKFSTLKVVSPEGTENLTTDSPDSAPSKASGSTLVDSNGNSDWKVTDEFTKTNVKEAGTLAEVSLSQLSDASPPKITEGCNVLNGNLKRDTIEKAYIASHEAEHSEEPEFQDTFEELLIPPEPIAATIIYQDALKENRADVVNQTSAAESKVVRREEMLEAVFTNFEQIDSGNLLETFEEMNASGVAGLKSPFGVELVEEPELSTKRLLQSQNMEPREMADLSGCETSLDTLNTVNEELVLEGVAQLTTESSDVVHSLGDDDLESLEELKVNNEQTEMLMQQPAVPKLDLNGVRESGGNELRSHHHDFQQTVTDRTSCKISVQNEGSDSGKAPVPLERISIESDIEPPPKVLSTLKQLNTQPSYGTEKVQLDGAPKNFSSFVPVKASAEAQPDSDEVGVPTDLKVAALEADVLIKVESDSAPSATSEDVDSECFFTDAAPSHESMASSYESGSRDIGMETEVLNNDNSAEGTLMEDETSGRIDTSSNDDNVKRNISSVIQKSEHLIAKADLVVDTHEFSDDLLILTRSSELVANDVNDSALSITGRMSYGKQKGQSEEFESQSLVREKPKRFMLSVSPPNNNSPRSPLAARFITTMPSQKRSPRTLMDTPRSPVARVASPLGRLLLEDSLNDSLGAMLSLWRQKSTSLEAVASPSFARKTAPNAELEVEETGNEGNKSKSWPDHSWLGDATYDLNSIPEPKNLFNITPIDLSEVITDRETETETGNVHRAVDENQRVLVLPDLTCDTPLPKQCMSRMVAIVDHSQNRFYCDNANEVIDLIGEYAECIWSMFNAGKQIQIDVEETNFGENSAKVAYRQMLADECCAVARKAIGRDVHNVWLNHGAPLWPKDLLELKGILRRNVFDVLYPGETFCDVAFMQYVWDNDNSKPSPKTRWEIVCRDEMLKSSPEMYTLTKLVMDQLYLDQDRWRDFEPIEERIKEEIANDLFKQQLAESFNAINVLPGKVL